MDNSEFKLILNNKKYYDKLYLFLQNIFRVLPEDKFFDLVKTHTLQNNNDDEIYTLIKNGIKDIKPFMADIFYGLPALFKQKKIIAKQTHSLLSGIHNNNAKALKYMEIGSVGRYIPQLSKKINLGSDLYIVNDRPATYSVLDIIDRGGIKIRAKYNPLNNYQPLSGEPLTFDLITCYIGLHHIHLDKLDQFIASISLLLKPGGVFILRDHNCRDDMMKSFVSLIHTVFNIGSGESLAYNKDEFRCFRSIEEWIKILASHGLEQSGEILYQKNDPSDNGLIMFIKR